MKVAIFGAGLMGHAIALVHALGGHTVRMTDNDAATLARAPGLMKAALATLREGGEADASWTDARLDAAVTCCPTVAETLEGAELKLLEQAAAARIADTPGWFRFTGDLTTSDSGSYGFNIRVIPTHPHLIQDHELRLITWAS